MTGSPAPRQGGKRWRPDGREDYDYEHEHEDEDEGDPSKI